MRTRYNPLQKLTSYRPLEYQCSFYNQSMRLRVRPDGTTVLDCAITQTGEKNTLPTFYHKFETWAKSHVAWTRSEIMSNDASLFVIVHSIFRRFKTNTTTSSPWCPRQKNKNKYCCLSVEFCFDSFACF